MGCCHSSAPVYHVYSPAAGNILRATSPLPQGDTGEETDIADVSVYLPAAGDISGAISPLAQGVDGSGNASSSSRRSSNSSRNDPVEKKKLTAAGKLRDKGFSLKQLLLFYEKYEASGQISGSTTTEEVVKDIIIPATKDGCHYMASKFMREHGGGKPAKRLASHAWKAPFINTLLNILLDATGWQRRDLTSREFETDETEYPYGMNFSLYDDGRLRAADLLKRLPSETLEKTYWLCIFAVNEHAAICGDCWKCNEQAAWAADPHAHLRANPCLLCGEQKYNPCTCGMMKTKAGDANHEIDLFHFVVGLVDALVVCLDPSLVAIRRVWCVAEIGKALKAGTVYFRFAQGLANDLTDKLWNGDDLLESVGACDATNPADKEMILKDILALDGGIDAYDAFVNRLLELSLGCARKFKDIGQIGLDAIRRMQSLDMDMTWAGEKMTSLHELIPDDSVFSTMVQLTSLRIDSGGLERLENIDALRGIGTLVRLQKLSIILSGCTQIPSIDALTCLGQLNSLLQLTLNLGFCEKITSIDALACLDPPNSLLQLTFSLAGCSQITSIDALTFNGQRKLLQKLKLNLSCCQITSIDALTFIGQLKLLQKLTLNLSCCQVADISPLSSLEALTQLEELHLNLRYMQALNANRDREMLRDRIATKLAPATKLTIHCQ
eukprot:TRINITY_DN6128_c0_g3_i1.p1 TRINITY_DN6128_c0_g3~~TRINITY_DN6128_c0_g3_i1.p1  ORF type:complete len:668 (+),score=143.39 TRINITY_DN6128_c0_g3_i1:38-2041(+)